MSGRVTKLQQLSQREYARIARQPGTTRQGALLLFCELCEDKLVKGNVVGVNRKNEMVGRVLGSRNLLCIEFFVRRVTSISSLTL